MPYIDPVTDWNEGRDVEPIDMNRIEGNTKYNKETADTDRSNFTSGISDNASDILDNANDISNNIDQPVKTTSSVIFNKITTDNIGIKDKLFTGTLGGGGTVDFVHGINFDKILSIGFMYKDGLRWHQVNNLTSAVRIDSTRIFLDAGGSVSSELYRCLVTYEA